jgi:hypothetical protein
MVVVHSVQWVSVNLLQGQKGNKLEINIASRPPLHLHRLALIVHLHATPTYRHMNNSSFMEISE